MSRDIYPDIVYGNAEDLVWPRCLHGMSAMAQDLVTLSPDAVHCAAETSMVVRELERLGLEQERLTSRLSVIQAAWLAVMKVQGGDWSASQGRDGVAIVEERLERRSKEH